VKNIGLAAPATKLRKRVEELESVLRALLLPIVLSPGNTDGLDDYLEATKKAKALLERSE